MTNQYPYRYNTTQGTASEDDPRYETPGGAANKIEQALEDAKEYTDAELLAYVAQTLNLADDSVTRPKIAPGAVGATELDPSLLDYTTDIAVANKFNEVDVQLADTADELLNLSKKSERTVSVDQFGANGTGTVDDSVAVNLAVAALGSAGGTVAWGAEKTYLINQQIPVPSNISLVGNGATIKNTVPLANDGILYARGDIGVTQYPISANALKGTDILSFASLPPVSDGSYIYLSQTGTDDFNSFYEAFVRVESVGVNTVKLVCPLMHDYFASLSAKIQIVTPIKNILISGFKFDCQQGQDLSPVRVKFADSVIVDNIQAAGFGGTCVEIDTTMNFTVRDVIANKPSNTNPGLGYAVKIHDGSSFGVVSGVFGYKTRHTVDVAGGSHTITVSDCTGVKNTTAAFMAHGMHEKNITFQGCKAIAAVDSGFGIGNNSYGRSEEVSLINCSAYFCSIGFNIAEADNVILNSCRSYNSLVANYQIILATAVIMTDCESSGKTSVVQRSSNIQLEGCMFSKTPSSEFNINVFNNVHHLTIRDCVIYDGGIYGIKLGPDTSTATPSTFITIDGCHIINSGDWGVVLREDMTHINIKNCEVHGSTGAVIAFANAQKLTVKDNILFGNVQLRPTQNVIFAGNTGTFAHTGGFSTTTNESLCFIFDKNYVFI